jgi:hypothetical protein
MTVDNRPILPSVSGRGPPRQRGILAPVRLLVVAMLTVGGCGGEQAVTPDPVDASTQDSICPVPSGRAFVLTRVGALPGDQGLDVDGDATIDNEIGHLPDATRLSVNDGLAEMIAQGTFLAGGLIDEWTDPPTPNDPEAAVHIFHVFDEDRPNDPSDNYGGEGRFIMHQDAFDLNCQSATRADETVIADRVLTARRSEWTFELSSGSGQLSFQRAILVLTLDETYDHAVGEMGAVMSFCSLGSLPIPGELSGSVLDAIVNDPSLAGSIAVDIDFDQDGLERVVGDGVGILRCYDGDGTIIEGADCICHPDIVDGYSVGIDIAMIRAFLVGVI